MKKLIQESSAMGDYKNSWERPGSSYLWVGEYHHLNREEVKELIKRMKHWLRKCRLKEDEDIKKIYKTCCKTSTIAGYVMMAAGFIFVLALVVARFVKYINLTEAQYLKEFWLLWLMSVVFILGGAILLRHANNLNERSTFNKKR